MDYQPRAAFATRHEKSMTSKKPEVKINDTNDIKYVIWAVQFVPSTYSPSAKGMVAL